MKVKIWPVIIAIMVGLIVVLPFFICEKVPEEDEIEADVDERDSVRAINLADEYLRTLDKDPADYTVIKVETLVFKKGIFQGPHIWHITYKRTDLMPTEEWDMVSGEGEVLISVNLKENRAELLGYGE